MLRQGVLFLYPKASKLQWIECGTGFSQFFESNNDFRTLKYTLS